MQVTVKCLEFIEAKLQSLQDPGNFVKSTIKVWCSSKKNIFRKVLRNESIHKDSTRDDHVWTINPNQKCRTTTCVSNVSTLQDSQHLLSKEVEQCTSSKDIVTLRLVDGIQSSFSSMVFNFMERQRLHHVLEISRIEQRWSHPVCRICHSPA